MRSSDWSSDVCSSDLVAFGVVVGIQRGGGLPARQLRLEIVPACMRPRLQGIEAGHPVRALAGAEFLVDAERDIDQVQRLVDTALLVDHRSEEHTSELQSLMHIAYAVFCLKKKTAKDKSHEKTP